VSFATLHFLAFFALVTVAYFALRRRGAWALLLLASLYFYMVWRPIYVLLLLTSISCDYAAALLMARSQRPGVRRSALAASLGVNLAILITFKYADFFVSQAALVIPAASSLHLGLVLPLGISFYTFQAMSYAVDVYRRTLPAERNYFRYALFVMFFPQLVAGPIERAGHLLPQLRENHAFDASRTASGLRLILWGLLKKMVIADNLAVLVDRAYAGPDRFSAFSLLLATVMFAYQIFCDFSGYSDIAVGSARVLGVELMANFDRPYAAASISEFWQRWHISLSTWFRDYLYIPLGGNRSGTRRRYENLFVTFCVSGLWHGANWTFVVWGAYHGALVVAEYATAAWRQRLGAACGLAGNSLLLRSLQVVATFVLVNVGWVFFRAPSIGAAWSILGGIVSGRRGFAAFAPQEIINGLALMAIVELVQALPGWRPREVPVPANPILRFGLYLLLGVALLNLAATKNVPFIYFEF
jgi:D-alanyl-lipoteichoic acid acyltransferase DltB (MBOAT superfamily)